MFAVVVLYMSILIPWYDVYAYLFINLACLCFPAGIPGRADELSPLVSQSRHLLLCQSVRRANLWRGLRAHCRRIQSRPVL